MQWIVAANHYCCLMTRLSVSSISSPSPNPLQFFSLLNSFSIQNNSSATFILTCVCISKIGVDYLENNCAEEPNKLCEFKRLSGRILKTVDSVYQDVSNIDECRELCLNSPYRYRLKSIYIYVLLQYLWAAFKDISYFKLCGTFGNESAIFLPSTFNKLAHQFSFLFENGWKKKEWTRKENQMNLGPTMIWANQMKKKKTNENLPNLSGVFCKRSN